MLHEDSNLLKFTEGNAYISHLSPPSHTIIHGVANINNYGTSVEDFSSIGFESRLLYKCELTIVDMKLPKDGRRDHIR